MSSSTKAPDLLRELAFQAAGGTAADGCQCPTEAGQGREADHDLESEGCYQAGRKQCQGDQEEPIEPARDRDDLRHRHGHSEADRLVGRLVEADDALDDAHPADTRDRDLVAMQLARCQPIAGERQDLVPKRA